MKETKAHVSVLMCAHNEEKYIERSVSSVLDDKDISLELVLVDDKSTDKTGDIVGAIARQDSRLKVLRIVAEQHLADTQANKFYLEPSKHGGQSSASNLGLLFCQSPYIARLDADDICIPGRISKQLAYMQQNKDVNFLGTNAMRINNRGEILGKLYSSSLSDSQIRRRLYRLEKTLPHSSWFVKRDIYDRLNGYDQLGFRSEDLDFMLRASELSGTKFAMIDEPLISYRMHADNISLQNPLRNLEHAICAIVCSLLRKDGFADIANNKYELLKIISAETRAYKLENKAISYNAIKQAFVCAKSGDYIKAFNNLALAFNSNPTTCLYYGYMAVTTRKIISEVYEQCRSVALSDESGQYLS